MSPWWKKKPRKVKTCTRCHADSDVHDGLCRNCRRELAAPGGARNEPMRTRPAGGHVPPQPSLEPAHDRPWVHQGGG
jgi:hypothetical protein